MTQPAGAIVCRLLGVAWVADWVVIGLGALPCSGTRGPVRVSLPGGPLLARPNVLNLAHDHGIYASYCPIAYAPAFDYSALGGAPLATAPVDLLFFGAPGTARLRGSGVASFRVCVCAVLATRPPPPPLPPLERAPATSARAAHLAPGPHPPNPHFLSRLHRVHVRGIPIQTGGGLAGGSYHLAATLCVRVGDCAAVGDACPPPLFHLFACRVTAGCGEGLMLPLVF